VNCDKLIYLASPLTHKENSVQEYRYDMACLAVAKMLKKGLNVISPIVNSYPISVRFKLPKEYKFWQKLDEELIRRCDEIWVLMLSGWEKSKGIKAEIEFALKLGKKVKYVRIEDL